MKHLTKLLAIVFVFCLVVPCFAEIGLKAGYILNYADGEQKPIALAQIKEYKGLSLDLWATDFDKMFGGISYDWQGGLAINYKIPVTLKGIEFGIGYAIGARSPLAEEHEFIHGATMVVGTIKF